MSRLGAIYSDIWRGPLSLTDCSFVLIRRDQNLVAHEIASACLSGTGAMWSSQAPDQIAPVVATDCIHPVMVSE